MSIPGVGPSIAGQGAQEAILSLCGRFVNLFQNRYAAGSVLMVSSAVGIVGGLFCGFILKDVSKPLIQKIFLRDGNNRKQTDGYEICKNAVLFITWGAVFITLNVIVSKCLKLPFSRLATAGISIGGGVLGYSALVLAIKSNNCR